MNQIGGHPMSLDADVLMRGRGMVSSAARVITSVVGLMHA
jgi:hypothetical protein